MDFIQGTTLFTVFVSKWSGKITAEDTDYSPDGVRTPKKLLERGRKPIYPQNKLTIFDTLRKRAESILLARGVRYMKGYAIPDSYVDEVIEELHSVKNDFHEAFLDVVNHFEEYRDVWLKENLEFESVIRHLITKESVIDKFDFEFYASKIQPMDGLEIPEEKVSNQVLHEVSMMCKSEADNLVKRTRKLPRQELIDKLEPMISKLDILSFGNSRILSLLTEFKTLSDSTPNEPSFELDDVVVANMISFLSTCSSLPRMEAVINGTFTVTTMLKAREETRKLFDENSQEAPSEPEAETQLPKTTTASAGAFF